MLQYNSLFRKWVFIFILLACKFVVPDGYALPERTIKRILIINSYHKGLTWSDNIMDGIEDVFKQENRYYCDLYFEFLDTKRIEDGQHFDNIYNLLSHKFKSKKFDLIILSDDNALRFLIKYRSNLFPGTPVVFCGVNDYDPSILENQERITGILESFDVRNTLDLIPKLTPHVKNIVVIADLTTTGQALKKQVKSVEPMYSPYLKFTYLENYTMGELRDEVSKLENDTAVILISFVRDRAGEAFDYQSSSQIIAEKAVAPIYVFRDFYVGYGAMGGYVKSGYSQGAQVAKMALRILDEPNGNIPSVCEEDFAKYMFDYNQLVKWGINIDGLPAGSVIVNKPYSFYEQNKRLFWLIIGFVAVESFIIIMLIINILLRLNAEKETIKFKTVADNAGYGVVITDTDGYILYVNNYYADIHGYDSGQLINQHIRVFHHKRLADTIDTMLTHITTGGHISSDEIWHITKSGVEFPMLMAGLLVRNKRGRPLYVAITALDMTEHKKAQDHIRLLSSAIEQSKEGVSVIDMDENYIFFNEAYIDLHGFAANELFAHKIDFTYPESEKQSVKRMLAHTRNHGVFRGEMEKIRSDGTTFPIHISCSLLRNETGRPIAYVSSIRDITQQVRYAQEREQLLHTLAVQNKALEKQNIELEQYAYTVSHDLKSPLVTINCFLDIVKHMIPAGEVSVLDYLSKISSAAARMKQLLDNLLELSRVGRVIDDIKSVDLTAIANESIAMVAGYIEEKKISMVFDIKCNTVFADPHRLSEVLQNLLENSIKFMKNQEKPTITIGSYKKNDDVICYIRDNGIGIEPQYLDKIFLLFDKLDPKTEGTGVGLTLVKRIIENHGGRIWVESEGKNKGTTVFFTLPANFININKKG